MSNTEKYLTKIQQLCGQTDEVLNEHTGDGSLQFPALLTSMTIKFNWTDKQARENEPYIRGYIREHTEWSLVKGAKGGIKRKSDKPSDKMARAAAKKDAQAKVESRMAELSQDETDSSSEDIQDEDA